MMMSQKISDEKKQDYNILFSPCENNPNKRRKLHSHSANVSNKGQDIIETDMEENDEYEPEKMKKSKRHRTSPNQLRILEEIYAKEKMPSQNLRESLAKQLGMTTRRVQVWFQNKRAKEKRLKTKK